MNQTQKGQPVEVSGLLYAGQGLIQVGSDTFRKVDRCEVHWPGLCSQTPNAIATDDWTHAHVVCRKHAAQAKSVGKRVIGLKETNP